MSSLRCRHWLTPALPARLPPTPHSLCKHIQTHTHLHVCGGQRWGLRRGVGGVGGFQLVVFSLWVPVSAWSSRVAHNNPITVVVVTDGPKAAPGGCRISGKTFGLDFNCKSFWGGRWATLHRVSHDRQRTEQYGTGWKAT